MPLSVLVLLLLVAVAWFFYFDSASEEPTEPLDNLPADDGVGAEDADGTGDADEVGEGQPPEDGGDTGPPPDISKFDLGRPEWHKYDP